MERQIVAVEDQVVQVQLALVRLAATAVQVLL
jgi:hypothetical protein